MEHLTPYSGDACTASPIAPPIARGVSLRRFVLVLAAAFLSFTALSTNAYAIPDNILDLLEGREYKAHTIRIQG